MDKLLTEIRTKTQDSLLVYVCIEAERAIGAEDLLPNYCIICYENSALIPLLRKKGIEVFSITEQGMQHEVRRASAAMIKHPKVQQFINEQAAGKAVQLVTFHPQQAFEYNVAQTGYKLLNPPVAVSKQFEDKTLMATNLQALKTYLPEAFNVRPADQSYNELVARVGKRFVVQTTKSHTGEGTFFVDCADDYALLQGKLQDTIVKISEYVAGDSYTVNGLVTSKNVGVSGLSYQITGIPELTTLPGATVGNDWSRSAELTAETKADIEKLVTEVGKLMREKGFRGIFGLDLVVTPEGKPKLIEVNARQTANAAMQSTLEQLMDETPLLLYHFAALLDIAADTVPTLQPLNGSQVFLRAHKQTVVERQLSIGTYRLQSDNSAIDWQTLKHRDDVIYLDDAQDQPLVLQGASYKLQNNIEGFQLLSSPVGEYASNQELARIQLRDSAFAGNQVKPWILQTLRTISNFIAT